MRFFRCFVSSLSSNETHSPLGLCIHESCITKSGTGTTQNLGASNQAHFNLDEEGRRELLTNFETLATIVWIPSTSCDVLEPYGLDRNLSKVFTWFTWYSHTIR
jgi:hypothetical protein